VSGVLSVSGCVERRAVFRDEMQRPAGCRLRLYLGGRCLPFFEVGLALFVGGRGVRRAARGCARGGGWG
jgi:hypothetical protein